MEFERLVENGVTIYHVTGRIDSNTAPRLDDELKTGLVGVENLVFDLDGLEYTSSAGLRVLLSAYKTMSKQGKMTFKNVSQAVREIFDITGMSDFFVIE